MEDYKAKIKKLKSHFQSLAKRQGCVYEQDYHAACYDIDDSRVIGEINMWLAGSNVPIRKQPPRGIQKTLPKKVTDTNQYKEDVENAVKHPDVNKIKSKTAADSVDTDPAKAMPEVEKGVEKNKLNNVIKTLREYEDEFLPAWKKFDEKKLAGKKKAQRISEEKRKLEDAIMAWDPPLGNVQEWIQAIEQADEFPELQQIWDTLWGSKEQQQEARPTEEYREFIDFDTDDGEELELDLTPNASANDPVEKTILKAANEEFNMKSKQKIKFKGSSFLAYVAESDIQKAAGLEAFDKLKNNESMLFPFEKPQHVAFHMGSVKFPIDIVFLMDTSIGLQASKVIHNIQPGDVSRWAHNNVAAVVEFPGGTCKNLGIKLGSILEVE